MYIPPAFAETRTEVLHDFMRLHSFATLVTAGAEGPEATHLPLLLDERGPSGTLTGHVARANRQWRDLEDPTEVLVIFQGPHAYVSPGWYEAELAVPTWNYAVVHAYGKARLLNDPAQVRATLSRLVTTYESGSPEPWSDTSLPDDWVLKLQNAIVAFEIEITRLEGKFKLSQNRPVEDQRRVIAALAGNEDLQARALAHLQQSRLAER